MNRNVVPISFLPGKLYLIRYFGSLIRPATKILLNWKRESHIYRQFKLTRKSTKALKLRKYYLLAGISGVIISRCIHQGHKTINRICYAKLFSYWAILLITLDAYSDLERNDNEKVVTLNIYCATLIIHCFQKKGIPIPEEIESQFSWWKHNFKQNGEVSDSPLIRCIFFICDKFGESASICFGNVKNNKAIEENVGKMIKLLIKLMTAQLESLHQSSFSNKYDWTWYTNHVLENKFDPIFSSVLMAFPRNQRQVVNVSNLLMGMDVINRLFLHRQILDDLLDADEDIDNDILATPGYMLIDYDTGDLDSDGLAAIIKHRLRNNKNYARGSFFDAWKNNDKKMCKSLIIRSGIVMEFINIIEDVSRRKPLIDQLNLIIKNSPQLRNGLLFYYLRSSRSLAKLKKKVFS